MASFSLRLDLYLVTLTTAKMFRCNENFVGSETFSMTKITNISVIPDATQSFVEVYKRRRQQKKLGTLGKQLIGAVIVFGTVAIIFIVLFFMAEYYYNQLAKEKVCTSKECIESAMTLLQAVDFSQDPCEDFYQFACGKFQVEHPIPENYLQNSWFVEKENRLGRLVLDVLRSPISPSDLKSVRQTKELYQSCTNRTELNSIGFKPLFEILELLELPRSVPSNKTVGNFNLGRTLALAQRYLSKDILVAVGISKEFTNTSAQREKSTTIIKLLPAVNRINVFDVWRPDHDIFNAKTFLKFRRKTGRKSNENQSSKQVVKATIRFISAVIEQISSDSEADENVSGDFNSSHYVTAAYKIMTFASELVKDLNGSGNETDNATGPEQMTFSSLQSVLDAETQNTSPSNQIDWKEFVSTIFEKVNKTYDVDSEPILVENLDYFKQLSRVLGDAKPETIQRYVWWKIIEEYAKHTTSEIRAIFVKYYQALYGESVTAPRSLVCANLIKDRMSVALSYEVSRLDDFFEATQKLLEMLENIEKAFEMLVESMTWMDPQTKAKILCKAKSVTNEVGFASWVTDPEKIDRHYQGLELEKSEYLRNLRRISEWEVEKVLVTLGPNAENQDASYFVNPLQVNAYYSREDNAIIIPAGILQTPFYFRGLESLNYGAIGTILGHELTHGFDIEGKNYNEFGNRQENWWPNNITSEYEAKAKCFIDQYENFTTYENKKLNGTFTLAENIADNGGIRESFKAYQLYMSRRGPELKLPGFENFTHEQLLFLSYANIWCEASTSKYQMMLQDPHSPQRIRVLASLQNFNEFSTVYNCSKNSFMNPSNKCVIW